MLSLFRLLQRFWQRRDATHHGTGPSAARRERDLGESRAVARARFWDEVREGRLEAEERIARREP